MTTMHTAPARRTKRGALVALLTGAGLVLTPLTAQAAAPDTAAVAAAPAAASNASAQKAVDTALAQLGDPYVWAAAGPNAFDCSGLTQFAYKAAGISDRKSVV